MRGKEGWGLALFSVVGRRSVWEHRGSLWLGATQRVRNLGVFWWHSDAPEGLNTTSGTKKLIPVIHYSYFRNLYVFSITFTCNSGKDVFGKMTLPLHHKPEMNELVVHSSHCTLPLWQNQPMERLLSSERNKCFVLGICTHKELRFLGSTTSLMISAYCGWRPCSSQGYTPPLPLTNTVVWVYWTVCPKLTPVARQSTMVGNSCI